LTYVGVAFWRAVLCQAVACSAMGLVAFFALRDASIAAGLTIFVRLAAHFSAFRVAPSALLALVMELIVAVYGTAGDEDASSKKNFKIRFHNVIFLFIH